MPCQIRAATIKKYKLSQCSLRCQLETDSAAVMKFATVGKLMA